MAEKYSVSLFALRTSWFGSSCFRSPYYALRRHLCFAFLVRGSRFGSSCFHFAVICALRFSSAVRSLQFAVRTSFKLSDGLLEELADSGCGCYWRNLFAGAFCYADDIVLLAPCASCSSVRYSAWCGHDSVDVLLNCYSVAMHTLYTL